MFGIGGFNPVNLLATAAFGPLGGVVAQLAQQVLQQFGQNIIQQLGQQLGLPQGVVDDAVNGFSQQFGGNAGASTGGADSLFDAVNQYGQAVGASPAQIGQAQNDIQNAVRDIVDDLSQGQEARESRSSGGKAPGWLMAIAKALGSKLTEMGDEMEAMSKEIQGGNAGKSTEFAALGQEFSMVSNATSTTIKALGEALSNLARKQ